jgi:uncharacterized integral membrane protein
MRWLIMLPLAIIFALFALTNRAVVELGLWPFDYTIAAPVSLAILIAMAIAFVVGALITWFAAVGARSRARAAESTIRRLERQIAEMEASRLAAERKAAAAPVPLLTS